MDGTIKFDYYYGIEAEQFSFYRVPRLLIKDARFKELSSDAKLLYGLMLDRLALSIKNGWLDEENRVYIHYTLDNIMEDLFSNPLPSFHPKDLLIGIGCGIALRLIVYFKAKNAKKFRHGMEYGSARWSA